MADVKLCKDCKWCRPRKIPALFFSVTDYSLAKCDRPGANVDLVTGEKRAFCHVERDYDFSCGEQGKFWEAR